MSQFVRQHTRFPIELAVRVRCTSWDDYLDLYTTNLSRGGVFVATRMSAPIGTEVLVALSLPNGTTLELPAEVVHVAAEADADGRPPGMGLMFSHLDDETKQALEAMVTVARFTTRQQQPSPSPAPSVKEKAAEPVIVLEESEPASPRGGPPPTPPPIPVDARQPMFGDVVEQSLLNELARRLDLLPHEQLGVDAEAAIEEVEHAHARLRERYAPAIFKRYGAGTQEVLRKINDLLDGARAHLLDPQLKRQARPKPAGPEPTAEELEVKLRGEEARKKLRQTIERRIEDACRLRDLGQADDSIRAFEAVLALDRKNDYARNQLRALRDRQGKPSSRPLIDKLLKR